MFVCVAFVHSVPLSKGQTNTNINKNTNNNANYNFLYDLLSLLQNTEQEEPIEEIPIIKPPVHKPIKPIHPEEEDEDEEDDGSYKPEKPCIHNKPSISIHKPSIHKPGKPYRPHRPQRPHRPLRPSGSYDDRTTFNKNSNVASNTNVNDAAGEGNINSESDWGKSLVKTTPESLEKTEPEATN